MYNVDWPGWPVHANEFGEEFDRDARIRMVMGGQKLLPYIEKYYCQSNKYLLEIGPFFNPLSFHDSISSLRSEETTVVFLENDLHALAWLNNNFRSKLFDIDIRHPDFKTTLEHNIEKLKRSDPEFAGLFDFMIISQVLNYVDFKDLFKALYTILNVGGFILINNVLEYGIPVLFNPARPRNNNELVDAAVAAGFSVAEKHLLEPEFIREPDRRLVLVLTKLK